MESKSGGRKMTKNKMFFRMISASLVRRRSRMIVALLAIAIGATILSGLLTIYIEVPRQMGAEFRNYGANMIFTASEDAFTQEDVNQALSMIASEDLVGAAPYRYETVRIHEQPILAAGTDMEQTKATSPYWSVDGAWPSTSEEILVGAGVAESLQLSVGESITVSYTPQDTDDNSAETSEEDTEESLLDNYIDFTVAGILNTGGSEEDYVYMSTEDMDALTGIRGDIDLVELSILSDSEQLSEYAEKISASVPAVNARLVKRVTASETTVLSKLQGLILLVTIVVLGLTMICVATTMTAVVAERRREIGLRKAIGASDSSIVKEFMGEGIFLGGVGGILGSVLGFVFAETVTIKVFSGTISLRPALVPITIVASVAVTVIASILPIKSATSIEPAIVLKGE
jgi:putative ABC transport system permease protein